MLDFDPAGKLGHRNANRCETFPMNAVARLADVTLRMDTRRGISGHRVDPVNMPLADMPPALIHIGSNEVLMADAELMANRLVSAGVPCDLQVWDRQVHVFQAAAAWVPEARLAIDEIGTFVRGLAEREATGTHARRRARPCDSLAPQPGSRTLSGVNRTDLVAELAKKSGLLWISYGRRVHPVWHEWVGDAVCVVAGGSEQPLPDIERHETVVLSLRSKSTRALVAEVTARVEVVAPESEHWDVGHDRAQGRPPQPQRQRQRDRPVGPRVRRGAPRADRRRSRCPTRSPPRSATRRPT